MIVKIKKKDLFFVNLSFLTIASLLLILFVPLIYGATVNTTQPQGFMVFLTLSNQAPSIYALNISDMSLDPVSGSTAVLLIQFNVTDPDGQGNINGTEGGQVFVNLTLGTPGDAQFRVSNRCSNYTAKGASSTKFNCSINMRYYDNASSEWVVNITVIDSNGGRTDNGSNGSVTTTFTYNELSSYSFKPRFVGETSLNFSGLNLGDSNQEAKAPLVLNNTGNVDFEQINITADDLIGQDTPGETIAPTQFFVNASNSTVGNRGQALQYTAISLDNSNTGEGNQTLLHGYGISGETPPYDPIGVTDTTGNVSLIFWVTVPSSGISAQSYNTTWNITLVDLT